MKPTFTPFPVYPSSAAEGVDEDGSSALIASIASGPNWGARGLVEHDPGRGLMVEPPLPFAELVSDAGGGDRRIEFVRNNPCHFRIGAQTLGFARRDRC